ncbi:phospholipase D/nuclease [Sparassis latifolia]
MEDSVDEDIARAIALSLQELRAAAASRMPSYKQVEVITVSDDEDEPDNEEARFQAELQRAIEASKQDTPQSPTAASDAPTRNGSSTSFLSDRAQMERERLARQKRLRPELYVRGRNGDADNDEDDDDDDEEERARSKKRQHISSSSSGMRRANPAASSSAASSSATTSGAQAKALAATDAAETPLFYDGEIRQTANMHVDPLKDKLPTFRLTDILAPRDDIEFAILSAYCVNWPWLYSFFNPKTPVIVVAHDPQGNESLKAVLPNWVKTTPFLRNGMGCMHMKVRLLFYKCHRLRVVVSTANLIEIDWRDIENTIWLQDIPPRPAPVAHDSKAEDFPTAMTRVLRAVNVAPALISQLRNGHPNLPLQRLEDLRAKWDFSKVKVKLIPSMAGRHQEWPKVILTGHPALMKAVGDIGATTDKGKDVTLECQGSSIGTYSTQWMNEFYHSARGQSAQGWLDTPRSRRTKLPYPPVKILFPTALTVRESALGEPGGGTMFCRRHQWEAAKFPRQLFHQSKSKRGKVLMHSKMILATIGTSSKSFDDRSLTESDTEGDDDADTGSTQRELFGWLYVGSHNFTPSAWGTLSGSAFSPTLNITNYELGIVLPLRSEKDANKLACWERPPKKYVLGKDEPWIQAESTAFAETE